MKNTPENYAAVCKTYGLDPDYFGNLDFVLGVLNKLSDDIQPGDEIGRSWAPNGQGQVYRWGEDHRPPFRPQVVWASRFHPVTRELRVVRSTVEWPQGIFTHAEYPLDYAPTAAELFALVAELEKD